MTGAGELLGAGKPRRTGTDDGNPLAAPALGLLRLNPAFYPAAIDFRSFERLDRDRRVIEVERAARLAWRGADPAGELRKIVGGMQRIQRHLPVVGIDQMVPVRDHVVHRTAVMAERNAAVHAARRLILQLVLGQRLYELVPVLQALLGLFIAAVATLDLKESGGLSHYLFSSARALFGRSEEHTSELQSLMRISYAVFCLKKKKTPNRS